MQSRAIVILNKLNGDFKAIIYITLIKRILQKNLYCALYK